jgi:hypothetical protein
MSAPNPNKQPVELNRTSLYWGLLLIMSLLKNSKLSSSIMMIQGPNMTQRQIMTVDQGQQALLLLLPSKVVFFQYRS